MPGCVVFVKLDLNSNSQEDVEKDSISFPPHPLFGEHDCHPIEYLPLSILTYIHVNIYIYIHVRFIFFFLFYFELEIGNLTLWLHTKTH